MDDNEGKDEMITGYGKTIGEEGCAITAVANISATFKLRPLSPMYINNNFVKDWSIYWSTAAGKLGPALKANKYSGQFTHTQYNRQAMDYAKVYATLVNVKYKSSESPHWVGVIGIAKENGNDYLIISPTSSRDISFDQNSTRAGQGWIRKDGGTILVPVDKTREYVTFSTENSF
jgi:hypothetical protein